MGTLSMKLRATYGRSTRPPTPDIKRGIKADQQYNEGTINDYGNFDFVIANPDLGPENQKGGEGGLELYWGTRGSIVVTRYNQTVDDLISFVSGIDSVRSLTPFPSSGRQFGTPLDADGYGYRYKRQYLNVASIRNQGWETQTVVNTGPVTTRFTYSWVKSRSIGTTQKFRKRFPASNPTWAQYQPGATFQYLPEHTLGLVMTYTRPNTAVALSVSGTGRITTFQDEIYFQRLYSGIRLAQNIQNVTTTQYVSANDAYGTANINVTRRLSPWAEAVVDVQNLANTYVNDYWAIYATMGRQMKAGLRCRF
jgi:outer membrane cobalamin receptor